jgi:2'-5' RNA ligase
MDFKAHNYSCLMAVLPDDAAAKICAFSLALPDADIFEPDDEEHGRVRPDEVHATIKFGIHSTDSSELIGLLSGQDMIRLVLRGVTAFHNDDCIVLKVDVESEDLCRLNELVTSGLESTDTYSEYHPHVTIAYLQHREDDPEYYKKFFCGLFEGTEVWVDHLLFSTPSGEKARIELAGGFGAGMVWTAKQNRIANRVTKSYFSGKV